MQRCKEAIVKCCWLAGIFTLGCCVFGSLWSGLAALGDTQGARLTQGLFWGFVICWGFNGIALISLLTAKSLETAAVPNRQRRTDDGQKDN
jgi:hypothetical protein